MNPDSELALRTGCLVGGICRLLHDQSLAEEIRARSAQLTEDAYNQIKQRALELGITHDELNDIELEYPLLLRNETPLL